MNRLPLAKITKFLAGGGVAALFNLLLIHVAIAYLGFDTAFLRNIANLVAIELSLIFSFFIYRIWVWPGGRWSLKKIILEQLPLYHFSAGAALSLRVLLIFPLLDYFGVNYLINTLIGVLAGAAINYVLSDRLVFNRSHNDIPGNASRHRQPAVYLPEGLSPGVTDQLSNRQLEDASAGSNLRLSIVMPAYNEEGSIVATVEHISDVLYDAGLSYEILVVNDNSRDRTEDLLIELSATNPHVRYINNYYPNGFGFAVRCGLENFQGDAVAIVMADGSDVPEDIIRYYYTLQEGYDCVFGSRFIKGGKVIDYPLHKLIINRLANLFIQIMFALGFNDTTNAFKIYRREVIEGISPLISHHFNLTVELPLKAITRGYSYTSIPIIWKNRKSGISKLKIKEMGSRYLFIVLYIWLEKHLSRGDYHRSKRKKMVKING
ncbi:MAG: glycosyltransferase [Leptolyngbya sp. SIOISBB]|nr:glycosyltransferase [Leptolyngbya sp. SIOISBB]